MYVLASRTHAHCGCFPTDLQASFFHVFFSVYLFLYDVLLQHMAGFIDFDKPRPQTLGS